MSIKIDVKGAAKRAGVTMNKLADAVNVSVYTLRGIAYGGRLTSIETLYEITHVTGEVRIPGPKGTVIARVEGKKRQRPVQRKILPLRCGDVA